MSEGIGVRGYRCQGSKLLTQSMPQTCRPIIDRLKGLKQDTNPSFLQLFYSFSTAFLQLFHRYLGRELPCSFSTAFLQLFHSFSFLVLMAPMPYGARRKSSLFFSSSSSPLFFLMVHYGTIQIVSILERRFKKKSSS